MILNVTCDRRRWFAEADHEISAVVSEAIGSLQGRYRGDCWYPGTAASFSWSDHRHMDYADMPNNFLMVSANSETGYGGLIWFVTSEYPGPPEPDEVLDNVWVLDNPNPPEFDPVVVSNTGEPYYFDPRSTLPIEQIEAAVDDFCRVRTGIRPECVQWTLGEASGRRADRDS